MGHEGDMVGEGDMGQGCPIDPTEELDFVLDPLKIH